MLEPLSQDELVWRYFNGQAKGFFVEVGANHPTDGSQSWHLEQQGWRGVLIEPQARLSAVLRKARPGSQVFQVACSAPDKVGVADLHIPDTHDGFASLECNVDDHQMVYQTTERVEVITLDEVLRRAAAPTPLDFLSLDTEGTELDVLRGLDLEKYRPRLILIEDKGQSLDKHRHLRAHGYRLVKRTELNNWYVPEGTPFTLSSAWERVLLWRKVFLGLPFRQFRRWRHLRRRPARQG